MNRIIIFSNSVKDECLSEKALVKKAIKLGVYSFELLLLKYKGYLYKIAYSYTKNECNALDLVIIIASNLPSIDFDVIS